MLVFEKSSGMRASFSGSELERLQTCCINGTQDAFIERLQQLGILSSFEKHVRQEIMAGITGESVLAPEAIHIELTDFCPLQCRQCYRLNSTVQTELPLPLLEQYIAEARRLQVFQIALGGGEPLIYPGLIEIVSIIGKTNMAVSITTSGWGLTKEKLAELKAAGLNHMQVSLNSMEKSVNTLSRDGYDNAIQALELLANSNLSFGINFVARKDNLADFMKTAAYGAGLAADNINILRYKPVVGENYQAIALDCQQHRQLAAMIGRVRGIRVKVDSAYSPLLFYLYGQRAGTFYGCGAGRTFMAITAGGRFKPCSHLAFSEAADSIGQWWQHSTTLTAFRNKPLQERCRRCTFGRLCGDCQVIGEQHCFAFIES